jgi:hypothetical protein
MMPDELDIDVCNNFTGVNIVARGVSERSTIREIDDAMRRNFVEKEKAHNLFQIAPGIGDSTGSCVLCLSNLGRLVIKEPFEDVWMQQTMDSNLGNGSLCFLTWSKIANGKNDFWRRLRYSSKVFQRRQAEDLGK